MKSLHFSLIFSGGCFLVLAVALWTTANEPEAPAVERRVFGSADTVKPLAVGDRVPGASLVTMAGEQTTLAEVLGGKPTVLVFFRGGW
jgi:hypothetical protein